MTSALLDAQNASRALRNLAHPIAKLIDDAAFDEHDRDIATAGLCGTFALALLETLRSEGISAKGAVAYIGEPSLNPKRIEWRHALIISDGRYFDVDGEVKPTHVLENYCWGRATKPCGLQNLDDEAFRTLIIRTRNSFDGRWLARWARSLRRAARTPRSHHDARSTAVF